MVQKKILENQSVPCGLQLRAKQTGQVIVEYALVLVVIIGIGVAVVRQLISRDGVPGGESGAIIMIWESITKTIVNDQTDPPP
jgi:hypothetical protein